MLTTCVEKTDPPTVTKDVTLVHVLPKGKNTSYDSTKLHYALRVNSDNQVIQQIIAEPAVSIVVVQSTLDVDGSITAVVPIRVGMNIVTLNDADNVDLDGAAVSNVERIGSGVVNVVEASTELEI